jgi:fucose permease
LWGTTALCAVYVAFAMPIAMLGVAWPEMREALGRGSGDLGVLLAGYGLGRLSTAGSSGVLLSRLPFGRAVLASAVVLAAVTAYAARCPIWSLLILAVVIVGMASGVLESLGSRFMAVSASARSAGLLAGSYGVGATIGPAMVAFSGHWQVAYVVSSVITLLAGLAFLTPSLRWPGDMAAAGAGGGGAQTVGSGPRPRWTIVLVSLSLFAVFVGMEATAGLWTATFLEQARGIDRQVAGLAVSGFFAGTTLGRIALGAVDVPRRVSSLLVSVPVPLFAAVAVSPSAMVPVLMILAGLALAPTFPMLMAATSQRVGVRRAGQVSGWQMLASNAGATMFPAMTGLVVGLTTPGAPMVVLTCMAATGAFIVVLAQRGPAQAPITPH